MEPCKAAAREPQVAGPRCQHAKRGLGFLLVGFAVVGLVQSLLHQAVAQASSMWLEPKVITLDASEDREHAVIAVDAEVKENAKSRPHGIELRDAVCALRAGDGEAIMLMHVEEVSYVHAARVNFDMELEHDSIEQARSALEASNGALQAECDLGVAVDLWRSGWTMPLRHTVSFPLGGGQGGAVGFDADFVDQGHSLELPSPRNLNASAQARYQVEVAVPQDRAERILAILGDAQVSVRGGVTFAEQDLGAFETRVAVDGRLQHWEAERRKGKHRIFALPLEVSGRADMLATGAAATATASGEQAELMPGAGRHYHVRPYGDSRQHHSVTVVARKRCALAKALGAQHVLSLRDDAGAGAPSLGESVAQGRKLLERKLAGATLEGYGFKMHTRLFVDEAFAARLDLEARGGNSADPAVKLLAGVVLRLREEEPANPNWNYQTVGVAFTARASLDVDAPRVSVDFVESLVVDATKYKMQASDSKWNNSMEFNGPTWEHEVTNVTSHFGLSLDWPTKAVTGSGSVRIGTMKKMMVGLRSAVYNWTMNPSKDYDPLTEPRLQLPPRSRRLLDAATTAATRLQENLPAPVYEVAGAARRLAAKFEEAESNELTVNVSGGLDFDGTGVNGNVFDFGISVEVGGMAEIAAGLNFSIVEKVKDNYTHSASASLRMPSDFKYGQVIAPNVLGGSMVDVGSVNLEEKVNLGMSISANAQVVTDMTKAGKVKVQGSVNVLPSCAVKTGQDAKVQTLTGLNATVATNNPRCQKCEGTSDDWKGWDRRDQEGKSYLYSKCQSKKMEDHQYSGSQWSSPASCCVFSDSLMSGMFGKDGMTMGSTWKESITDELNRPSEMTDIFGWLGVNDISLGFIPRINSTSVTAGSTTTRTWKFENGEVVMKEKSKASGGTVVNISVTVDKEVFAVADLETVNTSDTFAIIFSETITNESSASANGHLTFKKTNNGDGRTMDIQILTGKPRKQMFAVAGSLTGMNSANNRYNAQLTVSNDTSAVMSGSLVLTDGPGFGGDLDLTVRNDTSQVSKFVMVVTDVKDSVQAVADVYGEPNDLLVKVTAGGMKKMSGNLLEGQVSVKDKDNKMLIGAAGTFTKDAAAGTVDASLDSSDGNLANLTGTMPRSGSFFTGDLALTLDNHTQVIWMNASDGFVASGAKYGLPGFKRMIMSGGTLIEGVQLNVSAYLEEPPFSDGLSGFGLAGRVQEKKIDIDTSIDVDLPFAKSGTSKSGAVLDVVAEVVQEVTAEVVLADVTSFDVETFKEQMASQAGMAASAIEIERVDYKVDVTYNFAEAITESQAITAVASAAGVSESQVSVTITNARRLFDASLRTARRLQAVNVEASIRTATATAVAAIKTGVSDSTAVAAAVQTATGKAVTATVAVAPVTKVEVVTAMKAATAPVLTSSQLATIGEAVGGTVQVTKTETATRYTTRPAAVAGTASAASVVAPHRGFLLLSMAAAFFWAGNS